jgi:hypothetical protein
MSLLFYGPVEILCWKHNTNTPFCVCPNGTYLVHREIYRDFCFLGNTKINIHYCVGVKEQAERNTGSGNRKGDAKFSTRDS